MQVQKIDSMRWRIGARCGPCPGSSLRRGRMMVAQHSPGFYDDLLLVDSMPVECARSRETVKRGGHSSLGDALANAADYGYCASHSRHFWGFRLHALYALDGTPRALVLSSPKIDEKLVCLQMIARCERQPGQMLIVIGDKNFRGKDFEAELANLLGDTQRDELRIGDPPSGVFCPSRQEIVHRAVNSDKQQIEVGVHRGPPKSQRSVFSTADFDLPAYNPSPNPKTTASAVALLA